MNDILRKSDLADDALYHEYTSAVKPRLPPVPIELYEYLRTLNITFTGARSSGVEYKP